MEIELREGALDGLFAIARALFLARPEALLIAGLERGNFTQILDAIFNF